MASVTTMIVVSDRPQADGRRYVRYKFDLLDNNGGNHIEYIGPKLVAADFDTDADMIARAPEILVSKADQEQQELRDQARQGGVVLHTDMGGWFEKILPNWESWEIQTTAWLKYWLSQEDQLELVNMQADNILISSTDKRNLLDIANQDVTNINASVQIAIDTKATLDTYTPYFDDDGIWAGA